MFDLRVQLAHLHGGELVPMVRREHHDPVDHDLDRALAKGAKLYRCERCAEDVLVYPDEAGPHAPDGSSAR